MGQSDLFGNDTFDQPALTNIAYITTEPWSEEETLAGEKAVLGWYVSGHPITRYEAELIHFTTPIAKLKPARDKIVTIAGYVTAMRSVQTKSGNRAVFLTMDDRTARIDLAVFSEIYENARELLTKDQLLVVEGEVSFDDYAEQNKFIAKQIYRLSQAREKYAKYLQLGLGQKQLDAKLLIALKQIMSPFCGGSCPVIIDYLHDTATAHLQLGDEWRLKPTDDLLTALRAVADVEISYQVYRP